MIGFRGAAVVLAAALAVGGCGRSEDQLCEATATQERLFGLLRDDYPNKASQEMFGHGSTLALDRILKQQGLDRNKPDEFEKAVKLGIAEAKGVYQTGHYMLESVTANDPTPGDGKVSCSGRVTFLTAWGIVVKIVDYDVVKKGDAIDVKLTGMR
ncbi:MAG: hypothetical protein U1E28_12445 [Beijerinckiaceae bacterium]